MSAETNRAKTHCPQGHAYDEANTHVTPAGTRQCRRCRIDAVARHRARKWTDLMAVPLA